MTNRYEVCPAAELPPGERRIVDADGLSIGVFNVDGAYHAVANVCPHQLAPLCEGTITGEMVPKGVGEFERVRDGTVIQCPWHGWKFNIEDGTSVFNPHALGTRTFDVAVESKPIAQRERERDEYGTALEGDEPPVDTYPVDVEEDVVVLYV
jgi:nitrite reductase/ring-hydroxylating ferredoxin subunit